MKKDAVLIDAVLINTARGPCIDLQAVHLLGEWWAKPRLRWRCKC
jgi:hypothetical protein